LSAWKGEAGRFAAGQAAFAKRAKLNRLAAAGTYQSSMEASAA
jgi:fructose-bisphosphate aldolase class 1